MSVPWAPDPQCVPKELLGLLGGGGAHGGATVGGGRGGGAGGVAPPWPVRWGLCRCPGQAEVGPVGPRMLPGQGAQERREAPASKKAWGKERAVGALPPPETDEVMARHLQQVGGGGGAGVEGAGCCHLGGGEGGPWPDDMGPSGGLRGALLGGWAKPATGGSGNG